MLDKEAEEYLDTILKLDDLFEILEEEEKIMKDPRWDEKQRLAIFMEYSKRVNEHFRNREEELGIAKNG